MGKFLDLTGAKFGRLTVIGRGPESKNTYGRTIFKWAAECECGNETFVPTAKLKSGHTQSCGCLNKDVVGKPKTHGLRTGGSKQSKEYRTWCHIRRRCDDPSNPKYYLYGGRGISVCDRWRNYENFFEDMGLAPSPRHSIDRINTNGNYEPDNCQWATAKEQANNLRTTRFFTADGVTDTISGWADRFGVNRWVITNRMKRGASFDQVHAAMKK